MAVLVALLSEFEGSIEAFERRGKGGQQVPYHGEFASVAPSVVGRMRWWVREIRAALGVPQ